MPYIRKDEFFTRIQDRVKVILNIGDMLIESFEQIAETIVLWWWPLSAGCFHWTHIGRCYRYICSPQRSGPNMHWSPRLHHQWVANIRITDFPLRSSTSPIVPCVASINVTALSRMFDSSGPSSNPLLIVVIKRWRISARRTASARSLCEWEVDGEDDIKLNTLPLKYFKNYIPNDNHTCVIKFVLVHSLPLFELCMDIYLIYGVSDKLKKT